jgi:hypothetical protein
MRKIPCLAAFILMMGILFAGPAPVLGPAETAQLEDMLKTAGLERSSLCFEKDWDLSTKYKLDWQLRQLQDPWQALDDLAVLRETCSKAESGSYISLLRELGGIAFNLDPARFASLYQASYDVYSDHIKLNVRKPEEIFNWLEPRLQALKSDYSHALADFSYSDLDKLICFWQWQFIESEDAEAYSNLFKERGLPDYDSLDLKKIQESLAGLHLPLVLQTGINFLALSDAVVDHARGMKFTNRKALVKNTSLGYMVIGTMGEDIHEYGFDNGQTVCFILDPAGNDTYGINLCTGYRSPFYLLADLAGNDVYRNPKPAAMFCSAIGCGYSLDLGGDDLYQTGDFSFASFAGLNLHIDAAGEDIYRSGLFSQGASMFGVSLLLDGSGNDSYQATVSGQGFGSTHGAGALLDLGGADIYSLGGKYFHEPLMPLDYITLGQGMGLGLRPDIAGGLGLLYDKQGNDKYLGGVYAQGSGYWYATGALIDDGGNDVYNTVYYPQGSGIHLACGFLLDGAGDDAYYSRHGPGQGAGHDWGLGMLIDEAGNDAYSIEGGNGLGLTNSVGIFVDKSGDDRYERNNPQNYGNATQARSAGGIGLFLDAGGQDAYPDSLKANDSTWQNGTFGVGRDINLNTIAKTAVEELAEAAALPDSTDSIEDIFAAASEWEVGSAVQRVRAAREILVSRADEAIEYIMKNKLATDSGLEYRALETLASSSASFVKKMFEVIEGPDSLSAKNAMALIAGVGDSLLVDYAERLLKRKKYETACLSVLAGVNTERSVQLLREYIFHPSERFRYIAARSLRQIKHPSARQTLMLMRDDKSFLVQSLLRTLPPE